MKLVNGMNSYYAWMRVLRITLTSQKTGKSIIFTEDDLEISVEGYKYMSVLADSCTIKISNLPYSDIVTIISGEYYDVRIDCGYKSGYVFTIFKGGVLYISNSLNDRKTTITTILCASDIVAKFGQTRINLSLNSGINMYSALKYIFERAGIPNTNISESFKLKVLQETMNANDTVASWISNLTSLNESFISNSDDSTNSLITLFDSQVDSQKIHIISSNSINISGGYPQLNTSGLTLTIMPTNQYCCGEIIQIDNANVDISVRSNSEAMKNYGFFLDPKGQYMIINIEYHLENRGSDFSMTLTGKSRSMFTNITSMG